MVANAYGVKASAGAIIRNLENSYIAHKDHFTSMAQDVQKKKKTEVEFINGGIVKKAREKGIDVCIDDPFLIPWKFFREDLAVRPDNAGVVASAMISHALSAVASALRKTGAA